MILAVVRLENVAVAVARVVKRPPRCSNKGVPKRRCLQNVCENLLFRDRKAARAWETLTNLKIRQNPHSQRLVWGIKNIHYLGLIFGLGSAQPWLRTLLVACNLVILEEARVSEVAAASRMCLRIIYAAPEHIGIAPRGGESVATIMVVHNAAT